jgi:hypothetical protein
MGTAGLMSRSAIAVSGNSQFTKNGDEAVKPLS